MFLVDILAWLTWKLSGLPINKVIGSGTHLATSRFRYMIGDRLGIAGSSVNGYIVGETGESAGKKRYFPDANSNFLSNNLLL